MQSSYFRDQDPTHVRTRSCRRILSLSGKMNTPTTTRKTQEHHQMFQGQDFMVSRRQHALGGHDEKETPVNEYSGNDRLKRHREEVAGKVMIPESWGQESRLKDWIDYTSFDRLLAPSGLASAREALVASCQRLRIESRC